MGYMCKLDKDIIEVYQSLDRLRKRIEFELEEDIIIIDKKRATDSYIMLYTKYLKLIHKKFNKSMHSEVRLQVTSEFNKLSLTKQMKIAANTIFDRESVLVDIIDDSTIVVRYLRDI